MHFWRFFSIVHCRLIALKRRKTWSWLVLACRILNFRCFKYKNWSRDVSWPEYNFLCSLKMFDLLIINRREYDSFNDVDNPQVIQWFHVWNKFESIIITVRIDSCMQHIIIHLLTKFINKFMLDNHLYFSSSDSSRCEFLEYILLKV